MALVLSLIHDVYTRFTEAIAKSLVEYPTSMQIRSATPDDVSAVLLIANETVAEDRWVTRGPGQEYNRNDFLEDIGVPDRTIIVATVEEHIVGLIRLRQFEGNMHFGLVVRRQNRGVGIGRALVDAAITWSKEIGVKTLHLTVFSHNTAAIELYQRSGFRQTLYQPRHLTRKNGESWDLISMVRDLS
jgi:ribosomal protein S18 acetylase RimI-like enzyme